MISFVFSSCIINEFDNLGSSACFSSLSIVNDRKRRSYGSKKSRISISPSHMTAQLTHLTTSTMSHGGYLFHVFLHLLRSEIQHEPWKKKKEKKNVCRVHYLKNRRQGELAGEWRAEATSECATTVPRSWSACITQGELHSTSVQHHWPAMTRPWLNEQLNFIQVL